MIESVIFTAIQDIVFFALFVGIAIFFGFAFFRIYKGQPVFMKRASMATEKGIYKAMGVSPREEMTAKKYAFSVLLFSLFGLILMMAILMGQAFLFMNPEQIGGMSWHLASIRRRVLSPTPTGRHIRVKRRRVIFRRCSV